MSKRKRVVKTDQAAALADGIEAARLARRAMIRTGCTTSDPRIKKLDAEIALLEDLSRVVSKHRKVLR